MVRWQWKRYPAMNCIVCGAMFLACIAAPQYTQSSFRGDSAGAHSAAKLRAASSDGADQSSSSAAEKRSFSRIGEASYYANKFHGRKTASGERYDRTKFTAAHRTLPFGTMVKVTNLKNNLTVTVRVNDRGPQKKSRIIDLSAAAAKEIRMISDGVARVGIEIMEK